MFRLTVIILAVFEPGLRQVHVHYFIWFSQQSPGRETIRSIFTYKESEEQGSLCLINQTHNYLAECEP